MFAFATQHVINAAVIPADVPCAFSNCPEYLPRLSNHDPFTPGFSFPVSTISRNHSPSEPKVPCRAVFLVAIHMLDVHARSIVIKERLSDEMMHIDVFTLPIPIEGYTICSRLPVISRRKRLIRLDIDNYTVITHDVLGVAHHFRPYFFQKRPLALFTAQKSKACAGGAKSLLLTPRASHTCQNYLAALDSRFRISCLNRAGLVEQGVCSQITRRLASLHLPHPLFSKPSTGSTPGQTRTGSIL